MKNIIASVGSPDYFGMDKESVIDGIFFFN